MTREEYETAVQTACNESTYTQGNWNGQFKDFLAAVGLKITDEKPEPIGFYVLAPWPTPGADGKPVSVEQDPNSWPVPAWIVPVV